jgi:hypothetical protein
MSRRRSGEPSRRRIGPMETARGRQGCPATTADFVAARRPIALTGSDTAALATTTAVTIATSITASGSSTATSATATSATTTATFGQRGTYRQSSGCENQHEHSESSHVAPPP